MLLLGYYVIPDWLEEQLQRWEDPLIKLVQQLFLNLVLLVISGLISSMLVSNISHTIGKYIMVNYTVTIITPSITAYMCHQLHWWIGYP